MSNEQINNEQVSVNDIANDEILDILKKELGAQWHGMTDIICAVFRIGHRHGQLSIKAEYERLKRMEENVKKQISALNAVMELNFITNSYSEVEIAYINETVILLESLDK
jgi:hypothetical protein